ncbi:MAG: RAMP superfamily CRISPR-associated protein [Candidatus Desantisbacteria bacterium]
MRKLTLKIETCSEVLVGSGQGWGATIDSDIVFDEYGLPYIPAKRIKGVLRESAIEVAEMFEKSGINHDFEKKVERLFGKRGERDSSPVCFDNLYLEDYDANKKWLQWSMEKYSSLISRDMILNTFTNIRQQTAIDDKGIAKENSLRTIRVLKRDISFSGSVQVEGDIAPLCLAACNLRYIGTNRNRGFGHIHCELYEDGQEIASACLKRLEAKEDRDA